jgi:RimJ/RimL family protein N-acetyltransferase
MMENTSANSILLREVVPDDLPIFFQQQLDSPANHMAAFTTKNPADKNAFAAHWARIQADPGVTIRTILVGDIIAGHIAGFHRGTEPEVTYWLGREFWGRGIATQALMDFLQILKPRPLFARAAKDNIASRRVLEKCGFAIHGYDKFFANARGEEIEEVILKLI